MRHIQFVSQRETTDRRYQLERLVMNFRHFAHPRSESRLIVNTYILISRYIRARLQLPRRTDGTFDRLPLRLHSILHHVQSVSRVHEYPERFLHKTRRTISSASDIFISQVLANTLRSDRAHTRICVYRHIHTYIFFFFLFLLFLRSYIYVCISARARAPARVVSTRRFYAGRHRQKGNRLQSDENYPLRLREISFEYEWSRSRRRQARHGPYVRAGRKRLVRLARRSSSIPVYS